MIHFGLWGPRGLNQIVNKQGEGFYFILKKQGKLYDRFFFNVGQPDQSPPRHEQHKDDLRFCDDISVYASCFEPYYARYRLLDSHFVLFQEGDYLIVQADLAEEWELCFSPSTREHGNGWIQVDREFFVWSSSRSGEGRQRLLIGPQPLDGWTDRERQAPGFSQQSTPRDLSRHAVFYNLSAHSLLEHSYYVPVNKVWQPMIARITGTRQHAEGPMIFAWDSSFSTIILNHHYPGLARETLLALFEGMCPDGRLPQLRVGERISNRSNPPIWFLAAWEVFRECEDKGFLEQVFPLLVKNYQWWKDNRMKADHSFSWGTDNEENESLIQIRGKQGAGYESGLDDSPLWSDMRLVTEQGPAGPVRTMDQVCIDLQSLMICAAETLVRMAGIMGLSVSALEGDLHHYYRVLHGCFDLEHGTVNSHRGEHWNPEQTPVIFYPLLCEKILPEEVVLLEQILDSEAFDVYGMLPSLSTQSSSFTADGDYWRGRVWPPMVWLIARGLKKQGSQHYGRIKAAAEKMLLAEWERHGHIHENYSALTGNGEPEPGTYARSCPFYSWGGLLGIL